MSPGLSGPDIGQKYWGCLYDEARRNKVLVQAPAALENVLKKDGWNDYVIRAQGDHVQLWVNGAQETVDDNETDPAMANWNHRVANPFRRLTRGPIQEPAESEN